jgi:hypothetical protein
MCRGASAPGGRTRRFNSLMAELMEDPILNHMPTNSKSAEEAAEDIIQIVRTYLK